MNSLISAGHHFEKSGEEIDSALKLYSKERNVAISRQTAAIDKYEDEMKEIGDLEDIDRELGQMEAEQQGIDHNIMRHTNQVLISDHDDYEEDYDGEYDEKEQYYNKTQQKSSKIGSKKEAFNNGLKVAPNNEVKMNMRVALFGFLEASQNDENDLEKIYEDSKVEGGKVAEIAAENLFETQKSNLSSLIKMLEGYRPKQSGRQW
eukprot:CAMPEP_0119039286 /NCGR_PEP_ID=MMETSP1177-20130426/8682_1 /TAXON_ID=2985 /ORGANISM="Ochromonas sp, Strain CCMP1899" /LENGTH=204 /DNA_ID=CAMNT_0007002959 /DNA_START=284 /DNA_END=895 /DNA_ORIENTATION=+